MAIPPLGVMPPSSLNTSLLKLELHKYDLYTAVHNAVMDAKKQLLGFTHRNKTVEMLSILKLEHTHTNTVGYKLDLQNALYGFIIFAAPWWKEVDK